MLSTACPQTGGEGSPDTPACGHAVLTREQRQNFIRRPKQNFTRPHVTHGVSGSIRNAFCTVR